jgi:hypothetical protein
MSEGWELVAVAEPWDVTAEDNPMTCGCDRPPVVSGYAGQVRDLTVDWSAVARRYDEDVLTSVAWTVVPDMGGDAAVTVGTLNGMESITRVAVGAALTRLQAVATFGTGQTARQLVDVSPRLT